MSVLFIKNEAEDVLRIMIEPIARSYDLLPGEEVEIRGSWNATRSEPMFEFHGQSFVALWVTEAELYDKQGTKLLPVNDA